MVHHVANGFGIETFEGAKGELLSLLLYFYTSQDSASDLIDDVVSTIVNGKDLNVWLRALKSVGKDVKHNEALTSEVRNNISDKLIEAWYEKNKRHPSSSDLVILADFILYHALEGDTRPNKMQLEEYPLLSDTQRDRRTGQRGVRGAYEVADVWYENVGVGQRKHF